MVYIVFYVDDNLMVGNVEVINDAITVLKDNGLVLAVVEGLHDYLSCEINASKDKKGLGWDSPISYKHIQDVQSNKTPGMPRFLVVRPMVEIKKVSTEDKWEV